MVRSGNLLVTKAQPTIYCICFDQAHLPGLYMLSYTNAVPMT